MKITTPKRVANRAHGLRKRLVVLRLDAQPRIWFAAKDTINKGLSRVLGVVARQLNYTLPRGTLQ